ncbi:hypothetical protein [Nocardia sp. XZ_19_385]|uniref:hypothetical protein n=1 Tax=Nocardia sp. XZ_19_385 TaxID=2769488 RepID=UPI00188DE1C8|nr:hypothetical protein [Nocardia sp. XZ_19_385]
MFRETVMRAGRKVLTGVLPFAVVATFAGAGTASATDYAAQQARWAENLAVSATAAGIDFKTTVAPDLSTISTAVHNGTFKLTADSSAVNVESTSGAKVTEFPLSLKTVAGNTIPLAPQISADGKTLVVTPKVSPELAAELNAADLKNIATNPGAGNSDPIANGAAAGAVVGLVIGGIFCVPMVLSIVAIPVCAVSLLGNVLWAAVIGAIVGAVAPHVIPQILP